MSLHNYKKSWKHVWKYFIYSPYEISNSNLISSSINDDFFKYFFWTFFNDEVSDLENEAYQIQPSERITEAAVWKWWEGDTDRQNGETGRAIWRINCGNLHRCKYVTRYIVTHAKILSWSYCQIFLKLCIYLWEFSIM